MAGFHVAGYYSCSLATLSNIQFGLSYANSSAMRKIFLTLFRRQTAKSHF
jgi:hypothetical protein